ncbi:hypothetical protein CRG98_046545 [Punica granatum]|uniref:PGG domain-containing protein n=1 Tax=Punica granatum TaxID=22663 RepID=A0A2I0HMV9_PUNGR|nr:hypothetical protein CRG98_046545 [Punica granatum]
MGKVVKRLLKYMADDAENLKGETALAIHDKDKGPHLSEEIGRAIRAAAMKRKHPLFHPKYLLLRVVTPTCSVRLGKYLSGDIPGRAKCNSLVLGAASEKSREVFIVIAILVATTTYQGQMVMNGTSLSPYISGNSMAFVLSVCLIIACMPADLLIGSYGNALASILPPRYSFLSATVRIRIAVASFLAFGILFTRLGLQAYSAYHLRLDLTETERRWELVGFDEDVDRQSNVQHAHQ